MTSNELNLLIGNLINQTKSPNQYWATTLDKIHDEPITGFIDPKLFTPNMDDNGDWYTSLTCLLLVERNLKDGPTHFIESGFRAKWKDEDYFFWYSHDAIENVIGWMPMPALNFSKKASKKLGMWN